MSKILSQKQISTNKSWDLQIVLGIFSLFISILIGYLLTQSKGVVGIIWVLSIFAGFTLQKSRLCFASAFRDIFLFGSAQNLKGILLGLFISTIAFSFVMHWIIPNPGLGSIPSDAHILKTGLSTIIGGVLFGLGMVIAGGCVSGSLYRIGEGYVASFVTIVGVVIGLGLLSLTWNWWWDNLISSEKTIWLPAINGIGYSGSIVITSLLLLIVLLGCIFTETKSGQVNLPIQKTDSQLISFRDRSKDIFNKFFSKEWPIYVGASVLGITSMFMFMVSHPFGVTGEVFRWSNGLMKLVDISVPIHKGLESLSGCVANASENSGIITISSAMTIGVIPGSFTAALLSREFKIRAPKDLKRYIQSIIGGIMMGYAAGLAIGCTVGSFFSSIPSLSLSGWVFGCSLAVGAFFGVQVIKKI